MSKGWKKMSANMLHSNYQFILGKSKAKYSVSQLIRIIDYIDFFFVCVCEKSEEIS